MSEAASLHPGQTLQGGYRVHREIGAGKFAVVFAGEGPGGEAIAIKAPHRTDGQALRRFRREIKVMRQLQPHPNCVGYRAHGELEGGLPWLAMELVDGYTLKTITADGRRVAPRAACTLMSQVCDGFRAFHKLGLSHRDVTPDNIMITRQTRQVKIMDFGLMQDSQGLLSLFEKHDVLDGDDFADNLDAGLIAGTPEYMAPEQISDPRQAAGGRQQTDTTADVFALGVVFYELLAGDRLFPYERGAGGLTGRDGLIAFLDWRVAWRTDQLRCPAHVDAELWSIVRKALQWQPKQRQRDAAELGDDVRYYLETGQGVLEDDLSATIAQTVDVARLRQVMLTTAEFDRIIVPSHATVGLPPRRMSTTDTEPDTRPDAQDGLEDAEGPDPRHWSGPGAMPDAPITRAVARPDGPVTARRGRGPMAVAVALVAVAAAVVVVLILTR